MGFWRKIIGIDPDPVPIGNRGVASADMFGDGTFASRRLINHQLPDYTPPLRGGNPLADKKSKRVHGLHLDDYQPRSHEHGVQRVTFERSYPEQPEWTAEDMWVRQRPSTAWLDCRNRSPLVDPGRWHLPPMRDALADLIEHLHMVHNKLSAHDLVAVEVSVQHEPTPSREDGSGQGWNFAVHAVAVPQAVLDEEARKFAEQQQDAGREVR